MVYNKDKWIAAVKKAVVDLKTEAYTQGRVCATASVRVIRDGILDDMKAIKKGDSVEDILMVVREGFNELVKIVSKETGEGFASNASAAAKAAGFKSSAETTASLDE